MHAVLVTQESVVEELVQVALREWPGLRLYLSQRRAGSPPDPVMDALLEEVFRLRFTQAVDLPEVLRQLQGAAAPAV